MLDALAKVNGCRPCQQATGVGRASDAAVGNPPRFAGGLDVRHQVRSSATNYQVFPGDRVYVDSDKWFKIGYLVVQAVLAGLRTSV